LWANVSETAVCAFNFSNWETLLAVCVAGAECYSPVILQVTESTINYLGLDYINSMFSVIVSRYSGRFALHLDHGSNFAICKWCIDAGFSSVMIDKSAYSFEENVAATREVVNYAKNFGVAVEGELGILSGQEDGVTGDGRSSSYTDPSQAARFIEDTGVDSLAVAIGSVHGPFKGRNALPKLDIERLKEIKRQVGADFPLVLHGASAVYPELVSLCNDYGADLQDAHGIPDEEIQEAVKYGINKVNIDTDLRMALMAGLRQSLINNPSSLDIRKHMGAAVELVTKFAIKKIKLITNIEKCYPDAT
jgi:fructose-bisphosphate aldolase class II